MSRLNLTKLCLILSKEFSTAQLHTICTEFGVNAGQIGLDDPSLRLEAIIALVSTVDAQSRIQDLLATCARLRSDIDLTESVKFVSDDWSPKLFRMISSKK